ncbi:MAG: hypothetical protein KA885_03385 [Spirochaetes bacterium]|nr:hypothetical protein [Spirochaetota bacterium]
MKFKMLIALVIYFILIFSCKTNPPVEATTTTTTVAVVTTNETIGPETTIAITSTSTSITATTTSTTIDERLDFVIDDKTPKDVLRKYMEDLFNYIEEKISRADFDGWYSSLSKTYISYINNKKDLTKLSTQSDFLANRGIVLQGPKDFFEFVVIQAREGKKLKFYDYKYIDKNNVKVICELDQYGKFDYNFVFEDGFWKLDR